MWVGNATVHTSCDKSLSTPCPPTRTNYHTLICYCSVDFSFLLFRFCFILQYCTASSRHTFAVFSHSLSVMWPYGAVYDRYLNECHDGYLFDEWSPPYIPVEDRKLLLFLLLWFLDDKYRSGFNFCLFVWIYFLYLRPIRTEYMVLKFSTIFLNRFDVHPNLFLHWEYVPKTICPNLTIVA